MDITIIGVCTMEIKDRIWKQFMQTGDPGLFMLYKSFDKMPDNNIED